MALSILALLAMAVVAYLGAVQGAYRAAMMLAACLLAGALAFGLCGPLTGALGSAEARGVWYYVGDAVCLWAVFCVAFLGLRTLGETFLKNDSDFSRWADVAAGAGLGAVTGYFTVGLCVLLVQMLPTGTDLLGYEAFRYDVKTGDLKAGDPLWLRWDRGTIAFFGYLTAHPLGSEETSFYHRYGDVCPPPEIRPTPYDGVLNADDVLYYHWYRRWEYIQWRTGRLDGPLLQPLPPSAAHGIALEAGAAGTVDDVSMHILRIERSASIEGFPQMSPGAGEEFLLVTVRFKAERHWPRSVDSSQFYLLETLGDRITRSLLYGRARPAPAEHAPISDSSAPAEETLRGERFSGGPGQPQDRVLANGASFKFTTRVQFEIRTFVFVVPKNTPADHYHLAFFPEPPAPAAPPAAATTKPATARPPASTATTPAAARSAS